eukprot:10246117-Heterocapsa_arctica.AAC.1
MDVGAVLPGGGKGGGKGKAKGGGKGGGKAGPQTRLPPVGQRERPAQQAGVGGSGQWRGGQTMQWRGGRLPPTPI